MTEDEAGHLRVVQGELIEVGGEQVRNVHLPDERHDYGPNKRRAVYEFFADALGLDLSQADESRVELLPEAALQSFADGLPAGAIRSCEELNRTINNLR